jgi:hypothetical protein
MNVTKVNLRHGASCKFGLKLGTRTHWGCGVPRPVLTVVNADDTGAGVVFPAQFMAAFKSAAEREAQEVRMI